MLEGKKKSIGLTLLALLAVTSILAGTKALQIKALIDSSSMTMPPVTVASAIAKEAQWPLELVTVGTLQAVQGVTLSAEEAGKIVDIGFDSGQDVIAGQLLAQQDISVETAELQSAEAAYEIANINFKRAEDLINKKTIARSDYDDLRSLELQAAANLETIKARIQRKTITAPFAGRLGVRQINLGQVIQPMDPVVSLQALDPIYVNFVLPQKSLPKLQLGQTVRVTGDMLGTDELMCTITAISSEIDAQTRQVQLQATLDNTERRLRPGMFVNVALELGQPQSVIMIPATAVLYAPYGNSVFLIQKPLSDVKDAQEIDTPKTTNNQPAETETEIETETEKETYVLKQVFVQLGRKQGDFVAVKQGLQVNDRIVSTGVFKLFNGMSVVIDDSLTPEFQLAPTPEDA